MYVMFKSKEYCLLCDFIHSCILIQITILISYLRQMHLTALHWLRALLHILYWDIRFFENVQSVHFWIQSWQFAWEQHCSFSEGNLNDLV